jgi:SOS regulatory protein LexA
MEVIILAELNTAYMKYIKGKINSYNVTRGKNSSITLSAIYRMFYLKNNYCLYDNDRILYLTRDTGLLQNVRKVYDRLKGELELDYMTLFSMGQDRVDFSTIEELVETYLKKSLSRKLSSLKIIGEEEREKLVITSLNMIMEEYKGLGLFSKGYTKFFGEEIKWMKSFGCIELENYQCCERSGRKYKKGEGPSRLLKNSREREAIHRLLMVYEDKLSQNNLVDYEGRDRLALNEAKNNKLKGYTHILIDESRLYTKTQLQLINALRNDKSYGEVTYIYDSKTELPQGAFLTKPSRIMELNSGQRVRSFHFKKTFENSLAAWLHSEDEVETMVTENNEIKSNIEFIENYDFISLKNGMEYKFMRDITRKDSIILLEDNESQEISAKEMKEIPVFSNIAAGDPIYMNPEVEDVFYLPEVWVKGSDNHFLLHVKGDSMIGAGIEDGDHVVIKSTPSAQHRDIVAVDLEGNATLKRLVIKGRSAMLMPENEKYSPIHIGEEGAHILGIAIGILKSSKIKGKGQ